MLYDGMKERRWRIEPRRRRWRPGEETAMAVGMSRMVATAACGWDPSLVVCALALRAVERNGWGCGRGLGIGFARARAREVRRLEKECKHSDVGVP